MNLTLRSTGSGPGLTLNSAAGLPARVRIPVLPRATSRPLYELLGRVRSGFLVVSPFRIAFEKSSTGSEVEARMYSEYGVVAE
jgi:hypothetical protein